MYQTCIFCNGALGANEAIEHFPVGRRLAFDEARGRLWVVCRRCERWNLTPLDERWEAIEECERLFRETRLRVSTENIGLARIREGLELVRIGSPQRPELAAWRYGDQFGRRRLRHIAYTGVGVAALGGIMLVGPATGIVAGGGGWMLFNVVNQIYRSYDQMRVRLRLRLSGDDTPRVLRKRHIRSAHVVPDEGGASWALRVAYDPYARTPDASDWFRPVGRWGGRERGTHFQILEVRGDEALRVAGLILPQVNAAGARGAEVQEAVQLMEELPDPAALFARYAATTVHTFGRTQNGGMRRESLPDGIVSRPLADQPLAVRLALEMAAHEESERRALEGELALLELAWQEAEEIAAIADDLTTPAEVDASLARLKEGR